MKIKLKTEDPKQVELLRAMGSRETDEANAAMKIFAALVGDVAQQILPESNVISSFYDQLTVGEFDQRTIALDDYHDIDNPDYVRVSYSSKPGDLSSSLMTGADDFPLQFFNLQSAVSFMKKYLRAGQLNHAEKGISKMLNEVVNTMKLQGIQPILDSIANSQTGKDDNFHVIRSNVADQLVLKDFNRLKTLAARINVSAMGQTTESTRGINTLLMSPEMVEEIRGIAYEPMNTRGVPNSDESTALGAPEQLRQQVYDAVGNPSIYGTDIIQLNELGVGYSFNTIFDAKAGTNTYADHGEPVDSSSRSQFDGAAEELIIGLSLEGGTANGLVQGSLSDSGTGKTFNVRPDSQFMEREDKTGMYGELESTFISVEPKSLYGLIV